MEDTTFSESLIPKFVWDFVKKTVKSPIAMGILALIIWNYIKNKNLKKQKESIEDNWEEILQLVDETLTEDNTMDNSTDITATKIPVEKPKYVKTDFKRKDNKITNKTDKDNYEFTVKDEKVIDGKINDIKLSDKSLKKWDKQFRKQGLLESQQKLNLFRVTLLDPEDKKVSITVDAKNKDEARKLGKDQLDSKTKKQHQVIKVQKEFYAQLEEIRESITVPIEVGDTLLGGKFKNKKVVVKDISTNERGEPMINGKNLMKYRLLQKENISLRLNLLQEAYNSLTDEDIKFLDNINKYAFQKIDYKKASNTKWLHERIEEQKNNPIWKNLSNDKTSVKYFKKDIMDPTEGIFFVNVDFLIKKAGNVTGGMGKEEPIRKAFKNKNKLPTPQYWLRDDNLGEGNHRVLIAKEFNLKSVPVRIYWK